MTIDIEDFTEICHSVTSSEPELQRGNIWRKKKYFLASSSQLDAGWRCSWLNCFVSDVHLSPSPNPRHHNYLWPTSAATYPAVEIRSYFNVGVGKPGITLFLEVVMMDMNHINISDISSHKIIDIVRPVLCRPAIERETNVE